MILNNLGLVDYLNKYPNTALLRISPSIQFVDIALNLCRYANNLNISFIVQITPNDISENLRNQIGAQYIIMPSIADELISKLDAEGYIVYTPDIVENLYSKVSFDSVELSDLSLIQKNKFKTCFTLLDYSYSGFVKPFNKVLLFAIEGIESILFWILERTVYLRNAVGVSREPIFIDTIERNTNGIPITSNNRTFDVILTNHKEHNIENANAIYDEYMTLHTKTETIINGEQPNLTHFSYSFPFNKMSFSGFPLPDNVVLYEVIYTSKSKHRYVFSDIILKEVV